MTWHSKLKSFIEHHFHFQIISERINSPNIKITAQNSIIIINKQDKEPFSIDKDGNQITLNLSGLDEEQKDELGKIVKQSYEEEGELLKENLLTYSDELDQYKKDDPDKDLLNYFRDKLTKEDFEILKVSLFLKTSYKSGKSVLQIKSDIKKKFGDRGKNIANLCSSGYFENFIKPLWISVHKSIGDKGKADQDFREVFELIVKNGLLAVFVHYKMTEAKLSLVIANKIEESKKYGFAMISDQLYVHALSRSNVKTVLGWVKRFGTELSAEIVAQGTDFITVSIPIVYLPQD